MSELKAYVSYFTSFLINKLIEKNRLSKIERIILFGSAAKDEAAKESDIDIFIEVSNETKTLSSFINKILEEFYKSREAVLFKSKRIENKFNIIIGKPKDWDELYRSIMSTGIILYGKFETSKKPPGTKHKIIFYWSSVKKNRGAFLNKIYGFKSKGKQYKGLLEEWDGKKLGKSSILIPIRYRDNMIKLIKEHDADSKHIEIFVE